MYNLNTRQIKVSCIQIIVRFGFLFLGFCLYFKKVKNEGAQRKGHDKLSVCIYHEINVHLKCEQLFHCQQREKERQKRQWRKRLANKK